jgi:hypothetical protein
MAIQDNGWKNLVKGESALATLSIKCCHKKFFCKILRFVIGYVIKYKWLSW